MTIFNWAMLNSNTNSVRGSPFIKYCVVLLRFGAGMQHDMLWSGIFLKRDSMSRCSDCSMVKAMNSNIYMF